MNTSYSELVARRFKRHSQPYPHACQSIGSKIGLFYEKFWWHAQGKALEDYKAVRAEILAALSKVFEDKYDSTVCIQLFMIGRSEAAARPILMVFCVEKEVRKKAKNALDDSGLMSRLPGFRTGHAAEQPGIGILVQPGTSNQEDQQNHVEATIDITEIYFNPEDEHHALHTPIFAKQDDGSLRRASLSSCFDKVVTI
ncbi:hypothetical protein ACEQ8H_001670 [Pleosporales sp. CAS-2024a]